MYNAVRISFIFLWTISSRAFSREIVFSDPFDGPCSTTLGESGWCLELNLCTSALQSIRLGKQVTHCGFEGRTPIVCCPIDDGIITNPRITKKDEVLPPQINFDCGKRTGLHYEIYEEIILSILPVATTTAETTTTPISVDSVPLTNTFKEKVIGPDLIEEPFNVIREIAGGIQSIKNSWPWMALLGRRRGPNFDFFCSGILINEKYVITAAHCVLDLEPFFVRLGEHNYNPDEGYVLTSVEDFNITNIVFHPNYEIERGYDDIALLELDRRVTFRDEVSPICLPWGKIAKEKLIGEPATVTGWGIEVYFGSASSVLREVNITVFHPRKCEESFSTLPDFKGRFPEGMTMDNIICAGDESGGKDTCKGDSGGPIMHFDNQTGRYELAGIISIGYGCGKKGFPGIYAPLERQNTLQWIKNIAFN